MKTAHIEGLDDHAKQVEETAHQIHGPVYGFQEQVLVRDVEPDADGWASARVVNRAFDGGRGLALTIRYRKEALPYLWQWRNLRERAYVMGVEPGNAHMGGRVYNREHGTLPILETGERREYHLEVEATHGE